MKILYVKNNSERAKAYQLRTIIYEDEGIRYVKKTAACKEAIPHLMRMKENYDSLKDSIINPKIKLAKIIDDNEESLTFEFIDGESFQKKLQRVVSNGKDPKSLINEYAKLIKDGFKTKLFESSNMVTEDFKKLFGNLKYDELDGEICFNAPSNIDFLFSNLIQSGDEIYLIDYEWVFNFSIPIDYTLFRSILYTELLHNNNDYDKPLYRKMENSLMGEIFLNSFQIYRENYLKNIYKFEDIAKQKEKDTLLKSYFEDAIKQKEQYIEYLEDLAQSLRLKNRLIRAAKKITFRNKS